MFRVGLRSEQEIEQLGQRLVPLKQDHAHYGGLAKSYCASLVHYYCLHLKIQEFQVQYMFINITYICNRVEDILCPVESAPFRIKI